VKLGASVWPFQWEPPYEDAIRRIAALGFRSVELIAWDRAILDDYYTSGRVEELRRLVDGEGLAVAQFVHSPKGIASPDAKTRREAVDSFRRAVEVGSALGTGIMNSLGALPFDIATPRIVERAGMQTFSVDYARDLDWADNYERYVEGIRECAKAAAEAGMRMSIEATLFRYVSNADAMLRLIERTGSPNLGMNFDPSHLFPAGAIPHAVVSQLGERIYNCHFSDNDGTTNVHWRPGKGKIDWVAVMRALEDVGFDGNISIELEDVPGVSRASTHATPNPTATDEFAAESAAGARYVCRVAADQGIEIDWGGKGREDPFTA
jgi:sugar phosphate isomerase/epimerase